VRGRATATATASDVTGIRAFHIVVDGAPVATSRAERSCDYSRTVPCTNPPAPVEVTLDTAQLADASHQVQVGALDAAANEARSVAQTVTVDNHAPSAPTGLTSSVQSRLASSRVIALSWANPGGQVAPIAKARWLVCRKTSTECVSGSTPVSGPSTRIVGVRLATPGTWVASVYLVDAAGNGSPADAAKTTIPYLLSPRLRIVRALRAGRAPTVLVSGRIAREATGAIRVKYSAVVRGRTRTLSRATRGRDGSWRVRFRLRGGWRFGRANVVRASYRATSRFTAASVRRRVR
jgi:hypothetical protein